MMNRADKCPLRVTAGVLKESVRNGLDVCTNDFRKCVKTAG